MSVTAELGTRARIASPTPTRCCRCFAAPTEGVRFVDFDAAINRGVVVEAGSMAVIDSLDQLVMCEPCVREGAEVVDYRPQLHAKQLTEIKKLEIRVQQTEAYARRLEAALQDRPGGDPRKRRRG